MRHGLHIVFAFMLTLSFGAVSGESLSYGKVFSKVESGVIQGVKAGKINVTDKGLNRVVNHLDDVFKREGLETWEQLGERGMVERLRQGMGSKHDIEFYMHELKESAILKRTNDLRKAHQDALKWRNVVEKDLFHPDVINKYPEIFPPTWR